VELCSHNDCNPIIELHDTSDEDSDYDYVQRDTKQSRQHSNSPNLSHSQSGLPNKPTPPPYDLDPSFPQQKSQNLHSQQKAQWTMHRPFIPGISFEQLAK
jgi:hypothetical protein